MYFKGTAINIYLASVLDGSIVKVNSNAGIILS